MPRSAGILSLGTRPDATTWEKGCNSLGFDTPNPIKNNEPTIDELRTFFKSKPDWLFFGGHFSDLQLLNMWPPKKNQDIEITFSDDSVSLAVKEKAALLRKGSEDFALDANCKVILWGGCSVCSDETTIRTMRTLFGPHVLLGFSGLTGWKIVDAMLGGGFIKAGKHFFDRVVGKEGDAASVCNAWMETAKFGYGGSNNESKFRAIDPSGREWKLKKCDIMLGRSFI